MSDPATRTPTIPVEPVANGHPPATLDAVLARARRILGGNIHPDDYLPVTPEVDAGVDAVLTYLRDEEGVPTDNEAGVRLLRNNAVLQFHHGGQEVLCRRTDAGVIVLAVGVEQVSAVQRLFPPTERPGYVLEYPSRWS